MAGFVVATVGWWPPPAAASFCLTPPLADTMRTATAVFEATVESMMRLPGPAGMDPVFRVGLRDLTTLRGTPAVSVISSAVGAFVVGHRYLIAAVRRADGQLAVAPCAGLTRPAARSTAWRSWFDTLARPSGAARLFGAVVVSAGAAGPDDWRPVAGVPVVADGPGGRFETLTDRDGEYAFAGLARGIYRVAATLETRPDLIPPPVTTVELAGDHAAADLTFRAAVNGRVSGRVVDSDGLGVSGVRLFMQLAPGADPGLRDLYGITTTAPDGGYVFPESPPGRYHVSTGEPMVPAYATLPGGGEDVELRWAEHVVLAPLVVTREESIDVPVFVVGPAGASVDAEVRVQRLGRHGPLPPTGGGYYRASRSGRFERALGRDVLYRFTATSTAGAVVTHDQVADGTPVRLVLPR
ncbi:MAG: hypothetical protein AB7U83_16450 [Vicinamibacterales bacterium]